MDTRLIIFIAYMTTMVLLFVVLPATSFVCTVVRILRRVFSRRRS